ncbi:hypothetical protein EDF70_1134 [Neorhizobium sp. JUb45]|nr:hypothetical protein EDF70_1134 [Neorhizobium sp. JUb45]
MWLATTIARSGPPHLNSGPLRPTGFVGAVWLVWYNTKAWAVTIGAAASFAMLAASPVHLGVLLGVSFTVGAVVSLSLWCLAGLLLARLLKTDGQWRVLNITLGLLLAVPIVQMWFE